MIAETKKEDEISLEDIILVSFIDRKVLQQIYDILDTDNIWETIAPAMPGIELKDVECCKKVQAFNKSPTQLLLRIWSSKGYTVNHLFQVFAKTKFVRCMRIIKPYVNEKYHYLENQILSSPVSGKLKSPGKPNTLPGSVSKFQQASSSASRQKNGDNIRQRAQNSNISSISSATASTSSAATDPLRVAIEGTLPVSYIDLQEATNNFSIDNIVGKGGYGVVYRGELKATGGVVAVKRIMAKTDSNGKDAQIEKERLRQSLQELRTLARFRHDNILPIYAYSLEGPEPCLVYQFMDNGSLEDRLLCRKSTLPLSWTQKREISLGAAKGLLFLHSFAKTPIIHGDVKTANILLDKHMEPKLGDFGLSRDGQVEVDAVDKCPLIASHIKGTLAYLPPEFITSKILSTKLDVYSFGIVLLEIATGLRAYSDSREARSLADFCKFKKDKSNGDMLALREMIIDKKTPKYEDNVEWIMFDLLIEVGLSSSQFDRMKRPTMSEIVTILSKCSLESLSILSSS